MSERVRERAPSGKANTGLIAICSSAKAPDLSVSMRWLLQLPGVMVLLLPVLRGAPSGPPSSTVTSLSPVPAPPPEFVNGEHGGEFEYFCWCEVVCDRRAQDKVVGLLKRMEELSLRINVVEDAAEKRAMGHELKKLYVSLCG